MVEIQGTEHIEFPLTNMEGSPLFAGQETWLREVVNGKLRSNWQDIDDFLQRVRHDWDSSVAFEGLWTSEDAPVLPHSVAWDDLQRGVAELPGEAFGEPDGCGVVEALLEEIRNSKELAGVRALPPRTAVWAGEYWGGDAVAASKRWRANSGLVKASDFDVHGLPDIMDASSPGRGGACPSHWFRLEPPLLQVRCQDLAAAAALAAAAGTLFQRPGLRQISPGAEGPCIFEVCGTHRLELPLITPGGARPFAGQEAWLEELVNRDLRVTWAKLHRFVEALRKSQLCCSPGRRVAAA